MILTLDRGFGDVRSYPPGSHPGIIVLRPADQSARAATQLALNGATDQMTPLVESPQGCSSKFPTLVLVGC
jgi:hypothetical protein